MSHQSRITQLNDQAKNLKPEAVLQLAFAEFGQRVTFASSLGEEDQVITDMIAKHAPGISVFTLDTGRLNQETYTLFAKNQKKYQIEFKVFFPDSVVVEALVKKKGINLFYESVENRKQCCHVRKVEPLRRALSQVDAWITGLRRAQSVTRGNIEIFEWDADNQKVKINPLAFWTLDDVQGYIMDHGVDVNELHAQGFVSIGCAPCTRAIKPGEDIRAGRWWWESPEQKECGLHNNPNRPKIN